MTYVLVGLGALSVAYGLLMAVLYPAGGFFLVWVALGATLAAAGLVERVRLAVCVVCLVALLAVGCISALVATTATATPPAGLDCLVVNALRLEPHPSHQSLAEALALVERLRPRRAVLTHMSHGIGLHRDVEARLPENIYLGYDGLIMDC